MKSKSHFAYLRYVFLACLTITTVVIFFNFTEPAYGINPGWGGPEFNTNDGGVVNQSINTSRDILLRHIAPTGHGPFIAKITSDSDPVGFDLVLTEVLSTGVYSNTQLALMKTPSIVSMSDSVTIKIRDTTTNDPVLPGVVSIVTDSDKATPLTPIFTLSTTPNVYETTIKFSSTADHSTNTLEAKPGNIFSIYDNETGFFSHGFIGPNPNTGQGAILAVVNDVVTATIAGDPVSSQFLVVLPPGSGSGRGGAAAPALVVDSSSNISDSSGSGCGGDCSPPTLGLDKKSKRIVSNGFSYNGNPVDVLSYYTPYPLIQTTVGEENVTILKVYDNGGTDNIAHVGLAFGLGKGELFNDSKATINIDREYDGSQNVSVYDPENTLENVSVVTEQERCDFTSTSNCLVFSIYHTFREPLNFNMVSTNVWDFDRNSWQNYYNHGIEIEGDSLNPPKTKMVAFGEKDMRGLHELVQINKKEDLWVDKHDNIYRHLHNDRFDRIISHHKETILDKPTMHGCDRNCNWFEIYKSEQELISQRILDEILHGKIIKGDPGAEPFSYSNNKLQRSEDPVLQSAIIIETEKATKSFLTLFGNVQND